MVLLTAKGEAKGVLPWDFWRFAWFLFRSHLGPWALRQMHFLIPVVENTIIVISESQ